MCVLHTAVGHNITWYHGLYCIMLDKTRVHHKYVVVNHSRLHRTHTHTYTRTHTEYRTHTQVQYTHTRTVQYIHSCQWILLKISASVDLTQDFIESHWDLFKFTRNQVNSNNTYDWTSSDLYDYCKRCCDVTWYGIERIADDATTMTCFMHVAVCPVIWVTNHLFYSKWTDVE